MAKKSSKASAKTPSASGSAPAEEQEGQPPSPLLMRVVAAAVTSYLAEKIWSNRKALTAALWNAEAQATKEGAMLSFFEYFSSMGLLFAVGIGVGIVTSKGAAFLQRFF
ncbi:hypothetical protein PybrP1_001705 [[Pythium] brassicae (nom. inval.)]|nr:hypothetical protein PybrP1_001705 [[Pythium] brassicae (nom. inval.)]